MEKKERRNLGSRLGLSAISPPAFSPEEIIKEVVRLYTQRITVY